MLDSDDRQADVDDVDDEPGPSLSSPLVGWIFIGLFIAALIAAGLMLT